VTVLKVDGVKEDDVTGVSEEALEILTLVIGDMFDGQPYHSVDQSSPELARKELTVLVAIQLISSI
jgi:hypothetical protein